LITDVYPEPDGSPWYTVHELVAVVALLADATAVVPTTSNAIRSKPLTRTSGRAGVLCDVECEKLRMSQVYGDSFSTAVQDLDDTH
jgi:hypothetical protein